MTIFIDLDGTIIDSFDRHHFLLRKILKDYNINKDINIEEYKELKREGYNNLYYLVNNINLRVEIAKKIQIEWINNIEKEQWLKYDKLYSDAIDFLKEFKNYKLYFLTARSDKNNIKKQIKEFKIEDYVQDILVVDPKDSKTNKSKVIKEYKEKNSDETIIIIGDTEVEYYTAIENDIKAYILNRGFRSKNYFLNIQIEKTYSNLKEIEEDLKNVEL